jgi:Tfp pilus assembly protein PilX
MNRPLRKLWSSRRGIAGITAVAIVVVLNVSVTAAAVSGTRDQEVSRLRLEAVRAFYAAEAAVNLATREAMLNTDADANGTIGGVASRTISGATLTATASGSGPYSIVAEGVMGLARRRINVSVQ